MKLTMKNLFKFGFLVLFVTVGVAACNSPSTTEEEANTDSLETIIESEVEAAQDSIDSLANDTIDSLEAITE